MIWYKAEHFRKGVGNQKRPDMVFQIKMKEKKDRNTMSTDERTSSKIWLQEQRDRLDDFIKDF